MLSLLIFLVFLVIFVLVNIGNPIINCSATIYLSCCSSSSPYRYPFDPHHIICIIIFGIITSQHNGERARCRPSTSDASTAGSASRAC